jgi:hypothetical protein
MRLLTAGRWGSLSGLQHKWADAMPSSMPEAAQGAGLCTLHEAADGVNRTVAREGCDTRTTWDRALPSIMGRDRSAFGKRVKIEYWLCEAAGPGFQGTDLAGYDSKRIGGRLRMACEAMSSRDRSTTWAPSLVVREVEWTKRLS